MTVWLLRAFWVFFGPAVALVTVLHPRTRGHWAQRWGLSLPAVTPGAIWVHASSVGEGQAAAAICEALRGHVQRPVVLRTASTDTGLATASGHHACCARPVDAPWVVSRWLDRVRPRLLVLVDGDLWPNLMLACRARGIPVVVAGLREGRGTRRLRRWAPGLFARLAESVALWLVYAEGSELPGEVRLVDELKGLSVALEPVPLTGGALVAGSTRVGDEQKILQAWGQLETPPLLVLAPRHPSRFDEVAQLLRDAGVVWHRWSEASRVPGAGEVLLVDTVGDLVRFYVHATAAFVGGTFDKRIGGHSPAEATAAGLPVVAGPQRESSPAAWDRARVFPAGCAEELPEALTAALTAGAGAPVVSAGAAQVLEHLSPFLTGPDPLERPLRPWLWPLGVLWRWMVGWRNRSWKYRKAVRVSVPVISVGGLGSGGAGKTPAVAELVVRLQSRARRPAVLARGHGRGAGPGVRTPEAGDGAVELGDELAMFAARGVPVVSAPDRVAGALAAIACGADVLILDDGFQHRRLHRDLDLVVVDPRWPREGGPLPVGEAREGFRALERADGIWLSGPGDLPGVPPRLPQVRTSAEGTGWLWGEQVLSLEDLPAGPVFAFAGIARPGRFLAQLVQLGVNVRSWRAWPDHHHWSIEEQAQLLRAAAGATLVCTEKDWVRLPPDFPCHALRVALRVESGEGALVRLLDEVLA